MQWEWISHFHCKHTWHNFIGYFCDKWQARNCLYDDWYSERGEASLNIEQQEILFQHPPFVRCLCRDVLLIRFLPPWMWLSFWTVLAPPCLITSFSFFKLVGSDFHWICTIRNTHSGYWYWLGRWCWHVPFAPFVIFFHWHWIQCSPPFTIFILIIGHDTSSYIGLFHSAPFTILIADTWIDFRLSLNVRDLPDSHCVLIS